MAKVKLLPSGETLYVDNSKSLLEHLKDSGIYVKSSCGGHASCTDCVVKVVEGADNMNTPTFDEMKLLGNVFHITKERLSCQCLIADDVTIDISAHDKGSDEERRDNKSKKITSKFKVRKKEEYDKIITERKENSIKKQEGKDTWQRHWEKEGVKFDKKLGGNRRPKGLKDLDLAEEKKKSKKDRE
ncbi:2Fe-2S iron-sulfur cluster-binding protein [Bacteriovorax sp. Seq25_V]|uniref:2Fe-2S iron-sulfur cluster-binding protein n=1 Tax=Bacteriovorax sp. Seq25_V TaxID=1201288 RepID=UPI00038A07AF|nr:2Fe-2S iron-sulfur cluster-binding protein [Bacteriovorax sp. Seq25_V]EQC46325.1 2Fe-2S iron-sulfur cluster-binding domain protein [Bacteriovorax sp. Seq25_V]